MSEFEERENEVSIIGETNYRNAKKRFGIKRKDRRSHMYIIGKTGVGKSTLIKNLMIQDLRKGNGLALFRSAWRPGRRYSQLYSPGKRRRCDLL
jgi:DNA helicase HerA-like ATPase